MIDNTLTQVEGPFCASREEALSQPGDLYVHIKVGGIYRKLGQPKYAGEQVLADGSLLDQTRMALYEHLYPHHHDFYVRPVSEFHQIVTTPRGVHPRFAHYPDEVTVA